MIKNVWKIALLITSIFLLAGVYAGFLDGVFNPDRHEPNEGQEAAPPEPNPEFNDPPKEQHIEEIHPEEPNNSDPNAQGFMDSLIKTQPAEGTTYDAFFSQYFGDTIAIKSSVNTISLKTETVEGMPSYTISVAFRDISQYDPSKTVQSVKYPSLKHIKSGIIGQITLLDVRYKTIEEAKAMFDLLNENNSAYVWWNTEDCYYNYFDRKAPNGTNYAYCIVNPYREKDSFRIEYPIK